MLHKTFVPMIPFALGAVLSVSLLSTTAQADIAPGPRPRPPTPHVPPQPAANRDPVALARRDPEIAKQLVAARGGQSDKLNLASANETAVQVALSGQCGFAGCSSTTLVAFTFRSSGANTTTRSVLALVSCPPVYSVPCTVAPAEVRATGGSTQK